MVRGRARKQKFVQPISSVRRSQLITTYGIGSLIPVASESFIMLGQDYWYADHSNRREFEISEPNLARALNVRTFLQPPSGDRDTLQIARFPEWVTCPNCNRLDKWYKLARKNKEGERINECRYCPGKSLVTSRFVAACSNGHIQDFPYWRWLHKGFNGEEGSNHEIRLQVDGGDDSLRGIQLTCSCGAARTMENALGRGFLQLQCEGGTPWLPSLDSASCDERLTGLQRGASGVWRSKVRAAISIPAPESKALSVIQDKFDYLAGMPEDLRNSNFDYIAKLEGLSIPELKKAFLDMQIPDASKSTEEMLLDILDGEYAAFQETAEEVDGDEEFVCYVYDLEQSLARNSGIISVSQLPRLREVRVLTGFSRLEPDDKQKSRNENLLSEKPMNWLPAIEAFGEGIFVHLDPERLSQWESTKYAIDRAAKINNAKPVSGITPRELLLHSLSHSLMDQLALVTGYPASSIKERIYARGDQAGILFYTSTSDSAGSLGGLSAQGTVANILKVMTGAVEHARWCTADPVCIESNVRGVDNSNLAACHYCMLAPEVSCEAHNQFLDRACLIGSPEFPGAGYFGER
ncbi:DUF1998 domain-containing protein [Corynebacterium alimapuense]|uniref:MrfA-like Zn-binding domain-containing protein n=1 Tax=Corynebacterium alimapuense TaxID=1576874 RepID=A0A3M8K6Q4_9CORY|nr:DUF1998 domain-containing protein [Corynebacterium alimapuense]RNE48435.1 hypothetical protein C5L39_07955 [Corynebacterium alimapuense]